MTKTFKLLILRFFLSFFDKFFWGAFGLGYSVQSPLCRSTSVEGAPKTLTLSNLFKAVTKYAKIKAETKYSKQ